MKTPAKKVSAKKASAKKAPVRVAIIATIRPEVVAERAGLAGLAEWLQTLVSLETGHGLVDIAVCDDLADLVADCDEGHETLTKYPVTP